MRSVQTLPGEGGVLEREGGGGFKEDLCYNVFLILSLWLEAGCFEC